MHRSSPPTFLPFTNLSSLTITMSSPPKAVQTDAKSMNFPSPPAFPDTTAERKHKLERLAGAFRIFGKLGYDEGIAGHLSRRILQASELRGRLGRMLSPMCLRSSQPSATQSCAIISGSTRLDLHFL